MVDSVMCNFGEDSLERLRKSQMQHTYRVRLGSRSIVSDRGRLT